MQIYAILRLFDSDNLNVLTNGRIICIFIFIFNFIVIFNFSTKISWYFWNSEKQRNNILWQKRPLFFQFLKILFSFSPLLSLFLPPFLPPLFPLSLLLLFTVFSHIPSKVWEQLICPLLFTLYAFFDSYSSQDIGSGACRIEEWLSYCLKLGGFCLFSQLGMSLIWPGFLICQQVKCIM